MLLPLLMQLGMLGRDRHDGEHELGTPYRNEKKRNETVRESLLNVMEPAAEANKEVVMELITARPRENTMGALAGDYWNIEIAMLMEKARLQDEDESVSLLLLH